MWLIKVCSYFGTETAQKIYLVSDELKYLLVLLCHHSSILVGYYYYHILYIDYGH